MKLRFYMRGLGIGIIVTALIMGISGKEQVPLTDAEIKVKAAALGMVESDSLKLTDVAGTTPSSAAGTDDGEKTASEGEVSGGDASVAEDMTTGSGTEESTETSAEEVAQTATAAATGTPAATQAVTVTPTATVAPTATPTASPTATATPTPAATATPSTASSETVTITIRSGSGSDTVAKQIAQAGLVESASSFDQYLMDNGYSRRISVGTYEIPVGSTEEEIAKIITKSK